MFASRTKKTIEIEDIVVVVRKLSANSLRKASEARQGVVTSRIRGMGAEVLKMFREMPASELAQARVIQDNRQARFSTYDRDSILLSGIDSWSAEEKLGPESIADLDEAAAQLLYEAILDLSLPPLDPAEGVAKGKDD